MRWTLLDDDKTQMMTFESLGEMADDVSKVPPHHFGVWDQNKRTPTLKQFLGRDDIERNWESVRRAVDRRWDEGMKIYDSLMDQLRDVELPRPKNLRRRSVWSEEAGDEVDVDRLRRGAPYWRTTRRDHRPGPMHATIIVDVSTPWTVPSIDILWRGVAAVLLTTLLEEAGYRIELWAANHAINAWNNQNDVLSAVCLKQPTDPIDESTLVNAVSGWAFRTLFLGSYHLGKGSVNQNYALQLPEMEKMKHHITQDEHTFLASKLWNRTAVVNWVRTQLEEINS